MRENVISPMNIRLSGRLKASLVKTTLCLIILWKKHTVIIQHKL